MDKIKSAVLIDNNNIDNFINRKFLESYGVTQIVTFNNPIHALFYLQGAPLRYQLILSDIYLPMMDGFEFIDKFHELNLDKKHGKIRILSASINPLDFEKSKEREIQFIEKPLTIEKLKNT